MSTTMAKKKKSVITVGDATPEIVWEDPPAKKVKGRKGAYDSFFDALRENPGQFARFPNDTPTTSVATSINNGKYANTEQDEFEAVLRTLDDGSRGVWVRYLTPAQRKARVAARANRKG